MIYLHKINIRYKTVNLYFISALTNFDVTQRPRRENYNSTASIIKIYKPDKSIIKINKLDTSSREIYTSPTKFIRIYKSDKSIIKIYNSPITFIKIYKSEKQKKIVLRSIIHPQV